MKKDFISIHLQKLGQKKGNLTIFLFFFLRITRVEYGVPFRICYFVMVFVQMIVRDPMLFHLRNHISTKILTVLLFRTSFECSLFHLHRDIYIYTYIYNESYNVI